MGTFSYERTGKLIKVLKDGEFAGFLEQKSRRATTGLTRPRLCSWQVTIDGQTISASTLTLAKHKIEGKADVIMGRAL